MKKRKSHRKTMPNADQLQTAELQRYGYTRLSGGEKRTQKGDLNRSKTAQGKS